MNVLVIGGNGVVGRPIARVARENGATVHTVGIDQVDMLVGVEHHVVDRYNTERFAAFVAEVHRRVPRWDLVVDVIASTAEEAKQTCTHFGATATRLFFFSTTLVYSREKSSQGPISSMHPLAAIGQLGGYVDRKLGMEQYLRSRRDVAWTVLRPYHILGGRSLFGCLPEHNRDPDLLRRLHLEETLELCDGGEVPLNVVHPEDIAEVILAAAQCSVTVWAAYNCVNPTIITAIEYYQELARHIGAPAPHIRSKSRASVWDEQRGWELTTLHHVYSVSDLGWAIGFVPSRSLGVCIRSALDRPALLGCGVSAPVHRRMTIQPRPRKPDWV